MESKKIFVYFGILIVAFLLWNTWKADHAKKAKQAVVKSVAASHKAAAAASVTNSIVKASANAKPIQVKTDLIDVKINPVGGTIEQLKLLKYNKTEKDKTPIVFLNTNKKSLYVSQTGLVTSSGKEIPLVYKAAKNSYQLEKGQKSLTVNLVARSQGLEVTHSYIFTRNEYNIKQQYHIKNIASTAWSGQVFNQIVRKKVASKVPGVLHYSTFMGAALSSPENHYKKISFSDLKEQNISKNITGGWVAMIQHYFISAWVPSANENYHYYSKTDNDGVYTLGMLSPVLSIQPNHLKLVSSQFYAGPAVAKRLEKVAPNLKLTVDYGWLWFISVIIFWIMSKVHLVVANWGWSIVITTIIIKLIFYKLSATSYRSMARMRKLQPKIEALKQRHAGDRQKLGAATMELYKKEKVNPLGGCLPMVIQIPVFLALYYVLIESVELRQAPFMLWIHNLSQPDPFFILPILMGLSMFLQQRLSPPPPDPTQAKVMMFLPVIFTVLFLYFPAGLVLYWLVNNCVSIAQQYYITRQVMNGSSSKKVKKKKK